MDAGVPDSEYQQQLPGRKRESTCLVSHFKTEEEFQLWPGGLRSQCCFCEDGGSILQQRLQMQLRSTVAMALV